MDESSKNQIDSIAFTLPQYSADIDFVSVIDTAFETGDGVLMIDPGMSDEVIAKAIRAAISTAKGKSFEVQTKNSVLTSQTGSNDD